MIIEEILNSSKKNLFLQINYFCKKRMRTFAYFRARNNSLCWM